MAGEFHELQELEAQVERGVDFRELQQRLGLPCFQADIHSLLDEFILQVVRVVGAVTCALAPPGPSSQIASACSFMPEGSASALFAAF